MDHPLTYNEDDLLTRALQLIEAFHLRGKLATRDVQQIMRLDRQKARRTLKRLQESGLPITPVGDGNSAHWVLDEGYRQTRLRLAFGESLSLELGKQMLGFLEGTGAQEWLEDLKNKLVPGLSQKDAVRLSSVQQKLYYHSEPFRTFNAQDEVINQILSALFNETGLTVSYGEDAASIEHFQPLTMVVYRRALYLLGWEHQESGNVERLLAVDRISQVTKGPPMPYPSDWSPALALGARFGIWKEDRIEPIVLRFAADRAQLVKARCWHPSQVLNTLDDGRIELQMQTGGRELVRFCLEWGPKVEVVSPAWLREAVVDELRTALAQYR